MINDRRLLRALREKTECYACGRKGHWAHDYECTISPFSLFPNPQTRTARMTKQLHLFSQPRKVTTCFVLDDCDDDSETFANIFDGKLSFSVELTTPTSPPPIAFNAVDTGVETILDVTPQTTTGHGRAKMTQIGPEHKIQEWNVLRYAVRRRFTRLSETSCVINRSRERTGKHA